MVPETVSFNYQKTSVKMMTGEKVIASIWR
jgi:hypothetical protein